MTVKTKFGLRQAGRGAYLELVTAFPLASIKSDAHLHEGQKVMDQILGGDAQTPSRRRSDPYEPL